MELVYLWVKNYKNIHEQGFNFSPRFNCDYDEETNELTINENDDYIENFFGDNINVTAIVGKNGSGKSSIITLLENIESYSCELYAIQRIPFIVFFYVANKKKGFTNIKKLSDINDLFKFVENPHNLPPTHQTYVGMGSYNQKCTFEEICAFLTLYSEMPYPYETYREIKIIRNKTIDYSQTNIASLAIKNSKNNFIFELTTFMLFPKTIQVFIKKSLISEYIEAINKRKFMENRSECYEKINNILIDNSIKSGGRSYLINNPLEAYMINQIVEDDHCLDFFNLYKVSKDKSIVQEFYNKINIKETYSLSEFDNLIEHYEYDIENMTEEEKELLKKYKNFINFNFQDIKGRNFSNLSHGEKTIYAQVISIYDVIIKSGNNLIALDEPDLSLHPNWQKAYINEIMNLFKNIDGKYHILFTTHSPFLLSDIPKENVIFLDTYENGNCKVVDGLKDKKQTFGANIHTLLSDGFFMENGLMGDFAKGKIDKAIKLLNSPNKLDDKELKYCEQIISIIGEPIIKNQLQRMLDSKRLKKVDKIDKMERDIISLQRELRRLKNDKE